MIEETIDPKEEEMRTKVLKIVKDVTETASLADAHVIVCGEKAWGMNKASS